jgi:hypothetical protein
MPGVCSVCAIDGVWSASEWHKYLASRQNASAASARNMEAMAYGKQGGTDTMAASMRWHSIIHNHTKGCELPASIIALNSGLADLTRTG